MKILDHKTMRWLLLPLLLLLLNACSDADDAPGDQEKERVQIELKPCAPWYVDEVAEARSKSITRTDPTSPTWAPGYYLYDDLNAKFKDQTNLTNKSISLFFTQDGQEPLEGTFFYKKSDGTWWLSNTEIGAGDYYFYGFIPKEEAASASVVSYNGTTTNGNASYSEGAVLTINGLQTVTPSDVCVLIGAKDGTDGNTVLGLQAGHFETKINSGENNNFIFLLFDHLYASLRFRFKVDATYAALRTIRLKKLELIAYSSDSGGAVYAKFNVRITLKKTDDGSSPIDGTVEYTPDVSSTSVAPVPIFEWDNTSENQVILNSVTPTDFMGCFVPGDNTYFKLRSTYDVFDNNPPYDPSTHSIGNLIRENCQAENTIDLRTWFGTELITTRGCSYSLTMTVQPTYLYMLSDPDLNNPTVKIN